MSSDISGLLDSWPYQPGQPNVRTVTGDDGLPRVQIRLDLGVLQMFVDGRPDGQRPHDFESLLEYHEDRIQAAERGQVGPDAGPEAAPTADMGGSDTGEPAGNDGEETPKAENGEQIDPTALSSEDCRALRDEAVQYYHRYMALLVLEDFEGVVRDTTRNLRVLDLIHDHASEDDDRDAMEELRPYILMVRTRAMASQAIKEGEPKAAVLALDQGLDQIREFFSEAGAPQAFEESPEVKMLRGMREALVPKLPVSQKAELKARLDQALKDENYELAAILRDELKQMKE